MSLIDLLRAPEVREPASDPVERVLEHRRILASRPMIRGVFEDFYRRIRALDERYFGATEGARVELGSGSSMLKDYYPDTVTSDIMPAPHLERVLDAMQLDLPDASVRALYGINCFHHFPDPARFFAEVERVVRPGGGVILIDPYFGALAGLLYARLFQEETFDRSAPGWRADEQRDRERANQALSYVVLFRDRARLLAEHPELEVAHAEVMPNYVRYLLSGGLNFRQLAPTAATGALRVLEKLISPASRVFGLHHLIVVRRKEQRPPGDARS
ncbi:MAG TPA: class I SAM-dependent methyltransferase [Candidatus Limnocylindrales bacterium]|nr:class I SAM-dependent methyltransferase [Candidatus Limnocylindrales bacterium]